jgi:hypothetical protein
MDIDDQSVASQSRFGGSTVRDDARFDQYLTVMEQQILQDIEARARSGHTVYSDSTEVHRQESPKKKQQALLKPAPEDSKMPARKKPPQLQLATVNTSTNLFFGSAASVSGATVHGAVARLPSPAASLPAGGHPKRKAAGGKKNYGTSPRNDDVNDADFDLNDL